MNIPKTMMTQHPDAASRYISIQNEPAEAVETLTPPPGGFGIEEIMVDFEGKLTPYHQTAQVVHGLFDIGLVPGKDVFVTPRIASATKETTFKQLMALLSVVETNYLAQDRSPVQAVKEVVLPMVETATEVLNARRRIEHVIRLAHDEFGLENDKNAIKVIPLIEEIPQLVGVKDLLGEYIERCTEEGFEVGTLRYMLARSDPALSYGLVPAVLACKTAISRGYELENTHGVKAAPILGAGSLPFRGNVTPANIASILDEYSGIRTVTIQSGLRYDHPRDSVLGMLNYIDERIQDTPPLSFGEDEYERLINYIGIFTRTYVESFLHVIGSANVIADVIPQQRDRLARKSSVGYARDLARPELLAELVSDTETKEGLLRLDMNRKIELPRAISFTAALYTVGYPPEFIGTGRALKEIKRRYGQSGVDDLLGFYPALAGDLRQAGRYLHFENARAFFPPECLELLREDVVGASEVLEVEFAPLTDTDGQHRTFLEVVSPVLRVLIQRGKEFIPGGEQEMNVIRDCIIKMGKLRGSLG